MRIIGTIASSRQIPFSPASLPNIRLWLDAADTSTISLSGSNVTAWNDKSGNGYNFHQPTSANQPTSGVNTRNGKNVITFGGNANIYSNTAKSVWNFLSNSTGSTVFVVVQVTGTNNPFILENNPQVFDFSTGWYLARDNVPNSINMLVANATSNYPVNWKLNGVFSRTTYYYVTVKTDPSNGTASERSFVTLNNGTTYNSNPNTGTVSTATSAYDLTLGGPNYLTGNIGEVIICSGLLSQTDIDKTETYLADKWAI